MSTVLIVHPALAPYRIDLFNALGELYDVKLIFLNENLPNQTLDQDALSRQLIPFHEVLERRKTLFGRQIPLGIRQTIMRFKPDIVVTSEFGAASVIVSLIGSLRRQRYRHVIWTDDNPHSVHYDSQLQSFLKRLLLPRTDGLVTVSSEARELYVSKYNFRKAITSVPILQDEARFRKRLEYASNDAEVLIRRFQLENRKVILFVGRLAPEKNIPRLLRAFHAVTSELDEVRLVLVGDGPERPKLQLLAEQLELTDQVIFFGHAEGARLSAWYRIGGLLVLPSRLERFGAVVNEALLAGLPVVCSKQTGAGVLINNCESGRIVDVDEGDDLEKAISELIPTLSSATVQSGSKLRPSLMEMRFSDSARRFSEIIAQLS